MPPLRNLATPFVLFVAAAAAYFSAGCVQALGPGYEIDRQEMDVQFLPAAEPRIHVSAEYRLLNSGTSPLSAIEVRLPGRRRFRYAEPHAEWDSQALSIKDSPYNSRNDLLVLPKPWSTSESHTLRLSVDYLSSASSDDKLSFSPDAFFLPAESWNPELLPSRGIFATGGVPPRTWSLVVRIPKDFLIHCSGRITKQSHNAKEQTVVSLQTPKDHYPFVVAGHYSTTRLVVGTGPAIDLWTRLPLHAEMLREPSASLRRAIDAYNGRFGSRSKQDQPLWIVECPAVPGCFSGNRSYYAQLVYGSTDRPAAEMISLDSAVVDLGGGPSTLAIAAAPSLAASWLGYGRNPGFLEQVPPLSALPAFAASLGREAVEGANVRDDTIRRLLRSVPVRQEKPPAGHLVERDDVIRAKSLLFFYGLQDRFGRDTVDHALSHMLYSRRDRGFELEDLISALEQENHENVALFVRLWMKHPGVPDNFRSRYESVSGAALTINSQEAAR